MKTSEVVVPLMVVAVIFAVVVVQDCDGVLTGYEQQDITADKRFGCQWGGGMSIGVTCRCRDDTEMYIKENSIPSYTTATVEIVGCKRVRFGTNSIADIRTLRNLRLINIQSLEFDESSLVWYGYRDLGNNYEEHYDLSIPSLRISIENCNVSKISSYTFQGRINTILFDGVTINQLDPFAFCSLLQTDSIIIRNSEIKNLRMQPFKKFAAKNFEMDGVKIDLVPSRFLNNITVFEKFSITRCRFDTVRPGAFLVQYPASFHVSNTTINRLDGEAFKVTTTGDVVFRNNVFDVVNDGAFRGITLYQDPNTVNQVTNTAIITFDSNVFTDITRDSLSISEDFTPKFSQMKLNEECDCKTIDRQIKNAESYGDIKCLYDGQFITVRDFKHELCSLIASYSTTIVIVVVVVTLLIIIITLLVVYYRKTYLSKKYGSNEKSQKANNGNMSLIVPDGRTYRETELHVIVERADLLTTDL